MRNKIKSLGAAQVLIALGLILSSKGIVKLCLCKSLNRFEAQVHQGLLDIFRPYIGVNLIEIGDKIIYSVGGCFVFNFPIRSTSLCPYTGIQFNSTTIIHLSSVHNQNEQT